MTHSTQRQMKGMKEHNPAKASAEKESGCMRWCGKWSDLFVSIFTKQADYKPVSEKWGLQVWVHSPCNFQTVIFCAAGWSTGSASLWAAASEASASASLSSPYWSCWESTCTTSARRLGKGQFLTLDRSRHLLLLQGSAFLVKGDIQSVGEELSDKKL